MSRIVQQLMVYPPENLSLMAIPAEYINTDDFPCPTCKGMGWYWGENQGESAKHNCVECNGTGKMHAKITIEWRAGKLESKK